MNIIKIITTGLQTSINAIASALGTHVADTSNPHSVNKTQVGLNNVDNTSDVNKPISTATQTALNGKGDKIIQVLSQPVLVGSWSLVAGFYESNIANANITALSVVDVIPDNASIDIVSNAVLLPSTSSSTGSVKMYARSIPSGTITLTLNIWK